MWSFLNFKYLICASAAISSAAAAISQFQTHCQEFDPSLFVVNTTITAKEYIPANTTLLFPDVGCGAIKQNVSINICRIALNISTSPRSSVIFEGWFPEKYEGRFLATGNGGIDGCIKYGDIEYGARHGFAAVGSNNGHNGTGGSAFLGNEEVLKDYVWRSLHTITEIGKNLASAFYAAPAKKSYYLGCSGGGRQGIKAAEMWPHDYDGIVVGAPAVNFNNMTSWRASFFGKTGSINSTNFIPAEVWKGLIHNEVLRQCDAIDGVVDGIIEDPTLCHFCPETLLCGADGNVTNCLTKAQVEIVGSVLSPLRGANGELVYPAMQPGSEVAAIQRLYSGTPFPYSLDWFRYVVYNDSTWDDTKFGVADITASQLLNPFNVQTFPSDLSSFAGSHNGKMIIFHGQQDQQITSFSSERFYKHLSEGMALSPPEIDGFLRYFRISGMGHCTTGPGAWMIGQSSDGATGYDPESNVLAAIVRWVEKGTPPETIEGTKFMNDTTSLGVERRRKHCRYPYRNTFLEGDGNLAENWACRPT